LTVKGQAFGAAHPLTGCVSFGLDHGAMSGSEKTNQAKAGVWGEAARGFSRKVLATIGTKSYAKPPLPLVPTKLYKTARQKKVFKLYSIQP